MAQTTDDTLMTIDIVLEGGGVKGIGLVGAISTLEERGYQFQRIAGTSAGAIVGSLVAAGCSGTDISQVMQTLDYRKFRDPTFLSLLGPPGKFASLLINNGLYKGEYFHAWISEQLASCNVRTFADLKLVGPAYDYLPENQRYKLVVVTADLSKGQLVYLPWDYSKYGLNPDGQPVADAVRASMSIPFFYKPYHIGKNTLVDGGVLSNFPIDIFDNSPEWPTFGIKLSSRETAMQVPRIVQGPLSLATALFATTMSGHDQRHLDDPCTQKRTMFVDTLKIQATNFDITPTEQGQLYVSGQAAATKFLSTWDFDEYKKTCP